MNSFLQTRLAFFCCPLPDGSVDVHAPLINTPVLPMTVDVTVQCLIIGSGGCLLNQFDVVGDVASRFLGLHQLHDEWLKSRFGAQTLQWYSPHARSVMARYVQWSLWRHMIDNPTAGVSTTEARPLLDPIQELNTPAYMSLQDRLGWTTARVAQLFPEAANGTAVLTSPYVTPLEAALVWFRLSEFLSTHSPCPNLVM